MNKFNIISYVFSCFLSIISLQRKLTDQDFNHSAKGAREYIKHYATMCYCFAKP